MSAVSIRYGDDPRLREAGAGGSNPLTPTRFHLKNNHLDNERDERIYICPFAEAPRKPAARFHQIAVRHRDAPSQPAERAHRPLPSQPRNSTGRHRSSSQAAAAPHGIASSPHPRAKPDALAGRLFRERQRLGRLSRQVPGTPGWLLPRPGGVACAARGGPSPARLPSAKIFALDRKNLTNFRPFFAQAHLSSVGAHQA
jgi:hypothetical protein